MSDRWSIEYDEGGKFERFFSTLGNYEQAVLVAAIENVLEPYGIDICHGDWGKSLGQNLYEFRIRRSLPTILREYRPSLLKEIEQARRQLKRWQEDRRQAFPARETVLACAC